MKLRSILLTAALAASSLTIASAKSYHIVISDNTMAGNVQLKAGEYNVKVDGNNAIFHDVDNDKSVSVPVKVEEGNQKFDQTAVQTNKTSGEPQLQLIELGGSRTTLEFGQQNPTNGQ